MSQNQLQLLDDDCLLEYFVYATSYYKCETFIGVDGKQFSATEDEIVAEMVRRKLVEKNR